MGLFCSCPLWFCYLPAARCHGITSLHDSPPLACEVSWDLTPIHSSNLIYIFSQHTIRLLGSLCVQPLATACLDHSVSSLLLLLAWITLCPASCYCLLFRLASPRKSFLNSTGWLELLFCASVHLWADCSLTQLPTNLSVSLWKL